MSNRTMVCKQAYDFNAKAVLADGSISEEFSFKEHIQNKYSVLFFYPLDFTFVCPTEIIAFSDKIADFQNLNTELVGVSVDSHFTHKAWRDTPRQKGGIGEICFPLVGDISKSIARDYGVLLDESIALRATFIIDRNFVVKHQLVNDLPLGRNVDEVLRMIQALQHTEQYGEVCPAGWQEGDAAMLPNADGVAEYMTNQLKETSEV